MIRLHRLNGQPFLVNADLIATLQGERDTLVALTNGNRFVVRESAERVAALVTGYRARVAREALRKPAVASKRRKE